MGRAGLLLSLFLLGAQDPKLEEPRPIVAGFERYGAEDPVEGGRLLLGELGCTNCHQADPGVASQLLPKKAPLLADAGARFRPDWLARWIADPQAVKPGATMPRSILAADEVGALVHYLMSLKPAAAGVQPGGDPAKARDLFNHAGCAACHAPMDPKADLKADLAVIPRGVLKEKYASAHALGQFLLDPLKWRPSGRMPKMNLTPAEAMSIATLAIGLPPREADEPGETLPGLAFDGYLGSWNQIPNFASLKPYASGTTEKIEVAVAKREDNYALRFQGYVAIAQDGTYTFSTRSDDGSRLIIGKTLVVNNDGIHASQTAAGSIFLKKGKHALSVEFMQGGGGAELSANWEGPGLSPGAIPAKALSHRADRRLVLTEAVDAGTPAFTVDPALAARGREAFQKACVSCHQVDAKDKPLLAKPLASLKEGACKAVAYSLNARQTAAVAAALGRLDPAAKATPQERVHRTMLAFNCYACHVRGAKGGPEPGRNPHFVTTGDDLGEEGRIPPHLSDVGNKLRREWILTVLGNGTKVRPYMQTRMPAFGTANVGHLADDFEKAEPPVAVAAAARDKEMVKAGRLLIGSKGLSCITCHTFNGQKSLGIQGMDIVLMAQRLQRDWFNRYLEDPPKLRPGTRMPTYWPEGKSVLKTVFEGDRGQQMESIWQYLSDGNKAQIPVGIGPQPIVLDPKTEPLMYRNFIQGAGPRAIGVGYPERIHLAFDAQQMRPALLWQGDFIDASRHWVDRGAGFQSPLGENVLPLHDGAPFAVLAESTSPWPKETGHAAGFQFEGYELDKQRRPTFEYRFGAIEVKDLFEPVEGKPSAFFRRTLRFQAKEAPANAWFRAGVSKKIEKQDDGSFKLDNGLRLRLELPAGDAATVRQGGGQSELLVPLKLRDGALSIGVSYVW